MHGTMSFKKTVCTVWVVVCVPVTNCKAYFYVNLHMSHCYGLWWCSVVLGVPCSVWEVICSSLGYSYIGARTNTTQRTNICLGIHHRHVWLHLIRHVCPYLTATFQTHSNPIRTAAGVWPDCRLDTNSLCWRQTVGGDNIPVVSVSV